MGESSSYMLLVGWHMDRPMYNDDDCKWTNEYFKFTHVHVNILLLLTRKSVTTKR